MTGEEKMKIKLALLGLGNAGKAFADLLEEKKETIKDKYGKEVIVTAIALSLIHISEPTRH